MRVLNTGQSQGTCFLPELGLSHLFSSCFLAGGDKAQYLLSIYSVFTQGKLEDHL